MRVFIAGATGVPLGAPVVDVLTASDRARSDRARRALAWPPAYPTYREGYTATLAAWRRRAPHPQTRET